MISPFSSPGFVGLLTVNLDTADARSVDYVIQNFDTTTAGDSEAIGISAESTTTINAADLSTKPVNRNRK